MCYLPVRLFHACLSAIAGVTILSIALLQLQDRAHANPEGGGGTSSDPGSPPPLTPTVDDTDGDGLPNAWELANKHDPSNPDDAASDFDRDGANAWMEYQLEVSTGGASGRALGKWKAALLPVPPSFQSSPAVAVTLIECASNGVMLARVQGRLIGSSTTTSYPYIYSPETETWTRVAAPAGFSNVTSLTPLDVNSYGEVVGSFNSSGAKGFLWTPDANGGQSVVYYLTPPGGTPVLGFPKRISDAGYVTGNALSAGGRSFAADIEGSEIVFPGTWTNPVFHDVNNHGEFVGTIFNPLQGRQESFLAAEGYPIFSTGMGPNEFFGAPGIWGEIPDIDPDASVWWEEDYQSVGLAVDRRTGQDVDVRRGYGASFYWKSNRTYYGGTPLWYAYPGFAPVFGAVNNWGEFAGGYNSAMDAAIFVGGSQSNVETTTEAGLFFYDGDYKLSKARSAVYGISDDPRILIGTPFSLWADSVVVPVADLMPAGQPKNFSAARLAEEGVVYLQQSGYSNRIYRLEPDQDQDGDGMSDDWEVFYGFNPNIADGNDDFDNDGTSNFGEFLLGTNPTVAPVYDSEGNEIDMRPGIDTDGDGMPNVWEWQNGLNYDDPSDALLDFDRDGYSNLQEFSLRTDPRGAPNYRIREVGPFPGTNSVTTSTALLGNGLVESTSAGELVTESVFFTANPSNTTTQGGIRPSVWSFQRTSDYDSFSLYPSHGSQATTLVANSRFSGAAVSYHSSNPTSVVYWPSPSATPKTFSGASGVKNIKSFTNCTLSPAGTWLAGTRITSSTNAVEYFCWKISDDAAVPVKLVIPAGVTMSTGTRLHVNDAGYIAGTAQVGSSSRGILWHMNETTGTIGCIVLPPLPGGSTSSVVGISNSNSPVIAGNSNISGAAARAALWSKTGAVTNLGTLGGATSTLTFVSPNGTVAGTSAVMVDGSSLDDVFIGKPETSSDGTSISCLIQAQGSPTQAGSIGVRSLADSGEALGWVRAGTSSPSVPTLWRHGRAYPLKSILPVSAGYSLTLIDAVNAQGSLIAWATRKDGYSCRLLLIPDQDTDGDGLPDEFENRYGFNPFSPNSEAADSDADGLADLEEFRNGTDPTHPDSDRDGMKDGWEVSWGLLPLDHSDGALDPDFDQVNNLREFILGTNPTGSYRVEDLPIGYNRVFHSGADDGSVILQQTDIVPGPNGYDLIKAEPAGTPRVLTFLPSSDHTIGYEPDGESYWQEVRQISHSNAGGGIVRSLVNEYVNGWDAVGGGWESYNIDYLIKDSVSDPDTHLSLDTIEANLVAAGKLPPGSPLFVNALVSSTGSHRVYYSDDTYVLDHNGAFVRELPPYSADALNNRGETAGIRSTNVPAANGIPAYRQTDIICSNTDGVEIIPMPEAWRPTATSGSVVSFSDDGRVLLRMGFRNPDGSHRPEFHLLDLNTRHFTLVQQPGQSASMAAAMSLRNGRIVAGGAKPFLANADGTVIHLGKLRVRSSPTDPQTLLSSHSASTAIPVHVTSDGRITLRMEDLNYETIYKQAVPHNDFDTDGIPDDWETHVLKTAEEIHGVTGEEYLRIKGVFDNGQFSGNSDLDGDGYSAAEEFERGTNDATASDAVEQDDQVVENVDDIIITSFLKNNTWSSWKFKGGFPAYVVPEDPEDPEGGDEGEEEVPKKIFYLQQAYEHTIGSLSFNGNTRNWRADEVTIWDIETDQFKQISHLISGSWSVGEDSGSWTQNLSPDAENNEVVGDGPPPSDPLPPSIWPTYDVDTGWVVSSPTSQSRSESGSWDGDDWPEPRGSWSDFRGDTLSEEYTTDMLISAVDDAIDEQIDASTPPPVPNEPPVETWQRTDTLVEVKRRLSEDESDFYAKVADYKLVASTLRSTLEKKGKKSVGWYEAVQDGEGVWECVFKSTRFPDSEDDTPMYAGEVTRLEADGNNGGKAVIGANAKLSISCPAVLEINGQAGGQSGPGGIPTTQDAQVQQLTVNVNLGMDMRNFFEDAVPDEFNTEVVISKVSGSGKIKVYKKVHPADQNDHALAEVTLPLRLNRTDVALQNLYVEGTDAGSLQLGVMFKSQSGLRLYSVRNMRVVPFVEATTFVHVNDADKDGDGIPSWADGFTDKFHTPADKNMTAESYEDQQRFGDEVWNGTEASFWIDEWIDTSELTPDATITLTYDASDPSEMTLGAADESGSRVGRPSGKMRLWKGSYLSIVNERSVKDIKDQGNFVKSGYAYKISEHGSNFTVEALGASEAVNDLTVQVSIDPDGSGSQPPAIKEFGFTAIGMSVHEILPGGTQLQRRYSAPLSAPAPHIQQLKSLLADQLHYDSSQSSVSGNLTLPFTLTSDALNIVEEEVLLDPKVFYCINGEPQAGHNGKPLEIGLSQTTSPIVTSGVESYGGDLSRPFDRMWKGTLQTSGSRLLVGENTVELLAVDRVHGFKSLLRYNFEVEAIPGSGSDPDDDSYVGYTFKSKMGSGGVVRMGGGDFRPYTISLDAPVEVLKAANVTHMEGSLDLNQAIPVAKHGFSYFMGARSSWKGPVVLMDIPDMTPGANAEPPPPDEPDSFAGLDPESDQELGNLKAARNALDVNRDGDVNVTDITADLARLSKQALNDAADLNFYTGFFKGFIGNPKDTVTDTVGIGLKAASALTEWAAKNPLEAAIYLVHPPAAVPRLGYQTQVSAEAAGQRLAQWYDQNAPKIQKLAQFLSKLTSSTEEQVFGFLLAGQFPGYSKGVDDMPEEWRIVIEVAALIYAAARDHWLGMSSEERGYVIGYIAFEVAATAVGTIVTALSGGTAAPVLGAKIASTLRLVHTTLSKLKNVSRLSGPLDGILNKLTPVIRAACKVDCLVAGTLIATSAGAVPVEDIEVGMLVWAWDEVDNVEQLRRVEAVLKNPASPVWKMSYDVDGDFVADGSISGTWEHPVWSGGIEGYMPLRDMREGDTLRLKGGGQASVLRVRSEGLPQATYNISVEGIHNYYSGPHGVLTHNQNCVHAFRSIWSDNLQLQHKRLSAIFEAGDGPNVPDEDVFTFWKQKNMSSTTEARTVYGTSGRLSGDALIAHHHEKMIRFRNAALKPGSNLSPMDVPDIPLRNPKDAQELIIDQELKEILSANGTNKNEGWIAGNEVEQHQEDGSRFDRWIDGVKADYYQPAGQVAVNGFRGKLKELSAKTPQGSYVKGNDDLYVRPNDPQDAENLAAAIITDYLNDGKQIDAGKRVFLLVNKVRIQVWPRSN